MRTVRVGFMMGLGIGLMLVSAIIFTAQMYDLNEITLESKTNKVVEKVSPQNDTDARTKKIPDTVSKDVSETNGTDQTDGVDETKEEIISIKISKGNDLYDVSQILYDNKLIESKYEFQDYVQKRYRGKKLNIKTGVFNISNKSGFEEITKTITQ
ncbi:MAG: hypothetical protein A2Y24_08905 [Clostridiales bacterium GWE2_32_10]|nr:MAG: hypothetical protein A2Y24_08905 [Clostridiales bacterium GWE2_32_10]HBY20236.1 hypothetical protein [Clostridiales bacterium]